MTCSRTLAIVWCNSKIAILFCKQKTKCFYEMLSGTLFLLAKAHKTEFLDFKAPGRNVCCGSVLEPLFGVTTSRFWVPATQSSPLQIQQPVVCILGDLCAVPVLRLSGLDQPGWFWYLEVKPDEGGFSLSLLNKYIQTSSLKKSKIAYRITRFVSIAGRLVTYIPCLGRFSLSLQKH